MPHLEQGVDHVAAALDVLLVIRHIHARVHALPPALVLALAGGAASAHAHARAVVHLVWADGGGERGGQRRRYGARGRPGGRVTGQMEVVLGALGCGTELMFAAKLLGPSLQTEGGEASGAAGRGPQVLGNAAVAGDQSASPYTQPDDASAQPAS